MAPSRTLRRLIASATLVVASATFAPSAEAIPGRRLETEPPPTILGDCEEPVRGVQVGRGRRPGATVIVLFVTQEVQNAEGQFVRASTLANLAQVRGDRVPMRILVENRSLYDVGSVVLKQEFDPSPLGPDLADIVSVRGASYDDRNHTFFIRDIHAGDTAVITFEVLLNDDVRDGVAQNLVRIQGYNVLDTQRLHPQNTPQTPITRSRQTLVKAGIGMEDVSCFTEERDRFAQGSGEIHGAITMRKQANTSEVHPGMSVVYTLIVRNDTDRDLENVTVDDQFDTNQLLIVDAGDGSPREGGIRWLIPALGVGEQWLARYRVRVADSVATGTNLANTMMLIGDDLIELPTAQRRVNVDIKVIEELPATGVALDEYLSWSMQALLGLVIALCFASMGMWVAVRKSL